MPRSTSSSASSVYEVSDSRNANGIVPTVRISRPTTATRPPPSLSVSRPATRHRHRRPDALRRHQQTRGERRFAARHLVVERQDDHGAEQRAADQERRRRRRREHAVAEQPHVDQRPRRAPGVAHEQRDEHRADDDRHPHERIGEPAVRLALRQPEHDPGEAGREQRQPEPVQAPRVGAAGVGLEQPRGQHERHDGDRHVDVEDPPPRRPSRRSRRRSPGRGSARAASARRPRSSPARPARRRRSGRAAPSRSA